MTILTDAVQIRDEVIPRANTATRVGGWMVQVANSLLGGSAITSTFCGGNSNTTEVADVSVAVESYFSDAESVKTGSGIAISLSAGDVYGYFSGLDATHAYSVSYTFSFSTSEAADIAFVCLSEDLLTTIGVGSGAISATTATKTGYTYTTTFTGATDAVFGAIRVDSTDPVDVTFSAIGASITDLGVAV